MGFPFASSVAYFFLYRLVIDFSGLIGIMVNEKGIVPSRPILENRITSLTCVDA
jgi:hypothetical protein